MPLILTRIGNGAAFIVTETALNVTVLLGCGELRPFLSDPALVGHSGSKQASESTFKDDESADESVDGTGQAISSSNMSASGGAGATGSGSFSADSKQYVRDLKELMKRDGEHALNAVFIPDYRPEVSFMLPFLTEKCQQQTQDIQSFRCVPVYMTYGTKAIAPDVLTEYWYGSFGNNPKDRSAPYDLQDIVTCFHRAAAVSVKGTFTCNENLRITPYHSGHVAGGCAFHIEIGTCSLLYVHGFNMSGGRVLLPADIPRLLPSALIMSSRFAVTVSETKTAMERELMRVVHECVTSNGKVIIPVYRLGFFQEIATILLEYWHRMRFTVPIYVSDEAMQFPGHYTSLLRRCYTKSFCEMIKNVSKSCDSFQPLQRFDWKLAQSPGPFVLFTGPASICQGNTLRAMKCFASDPKNLVMLSEGCTPGSVNYLLYADPQRKQINKRLGAQVLCGVHYFPCGDEVDTKSIVELAKQVVPKQILLDPNVPLEDLELVKSHLRCQLLKEPSVSEVVLTPIDSSGPTLISPTLEIPLRIHKSMFNNPNDVQGMLLVEAKKKMMLVSVANGARRLKKRKHSLSFRHTWQKPVDLHSMRKKKRSAKVSSALSFLLSSESNESNEEDKQQQPKADVQQVLKLLFASLQKWVLDVPITCKLDASPPHLVLCSVMVDVSETWEVNLAWSFEDEELAGRVLGIAKQVIESEYSHHLD